MNPNKMFVVIPALIIATGLAVAGGYAAHGSTHVTTVENHTITIVKPAVTITRTVMAKPAPVKTVYMQAPATAPASPAAATPASANSPAAGAPSCTTVSGYYPGGEPGHFNSSGFCVMDGANGNT
jgi:hypothetical protein